MRADLHLQVFQLGTLPLQLFFVGADLQILDFLRHGLALADGNNDLDMKLPHLMHWSELCAEWLAQQGL